MSYIGNEPISAAFLTDTFSGNGSTVAFTMTVAPANTSSILVAITGVVQDPSTYAVSGTTLTFSAAPPSGTSNISVRYLGIPASGVTTTAYRTVTDFTATAGQTTFSVPSYTVGYIDVYRNGSRLGAADYTATNGTTVVLAAAATAGDLVVTESFYVSSVLNAIPATAGAVNSTYIAAGAVGNTQMASGAARANWGAGGVLQVVQVTYSTITTIASSTLADTGLSASITPSSTSSKILVITHMCGIYNSVANGYSRFVIDRSGTSITNFGTATGYSAAGASGGDASTAYLDSPSSASSLTYKIRWDREGTGTLTLNNTSASAPTAGTSTITLMEIAG